MPHVKQERRFKFDPMLRDIRAYLEVYPTDTVKGDLNYIVTKIVWTWVKARGLSYQNISEGIAALNDAAEEMRRLKLNPREDNAIIENGSAYDD
jgi:hypothetical protein